MFFNQKKALVGAYSVIVKTDGSFTALVFSESCDRAGEFWINSGEMMHGIADCLQQTELSQPEGNVSDWFLIFLDILKILSKNLILF